MRPEYASTVNVTDCPCFMTPMSASDTDVSICIFVKSSAISNRSGVWNDAATVCPLSTLREITVPSTGEVIVA